MRLSTVLNIYGGGGIIDIVFGSIATLLAAFISYKMPKKFLVLLPPVIINEDKVPLFAIMDYPVYNLKA